MFHIIIRGKNCAPYLRKCIKSLYGQTFQDWHAVIVLDPPTDDSAIIAFELKKEDHRIEVHLNKEQKGLGYNLWNGIRLSNAYDNDIIAILDADDKLAPDALETVLWTYRSYQNGHCLATYGSYIQKSNKRITSTSSKYPRGSKVRTSKWRASHLKTFKFKVFKHIPKEYFQYNGKWCKAASDRALMYSIIEIAGLERCKHIGRPIYIWRDNYQHTTSRSRQKKWDKIMRKKKPLKKVKF